MQATLPTIAPDSPQWKVLSIHGILLDYGVGVGSATDYKPVDPALWGKDHLTTLVYCEGRAVDAFGTLQDARMRTDVRVHPLLSSQRTDKNYPTILRAGIKLDFHDDWSCLADLVLYGLVELNLQRVVSLTDLGWKWAGVLRRYMAETTTIVNGRNFENFHPSALGLL